MSTELAVRDDAALDELASAINREHAAVSEALLSALDHAIRAGELLSQAKALCASGWDQWIAENFNGDPSTARVYVRLAHYQHLLVEHRNGGGIAKVRGGGIRGALNYLQGLPAVRKSGGAYPDEMRDEARRLRAEGASCQDIADMLGVSRSTVSVWCSPPAMRRLRSRLAAKKLRHAEAAAERQARQDAAIRRVKGPGSEAYSLVRRACQMLDRATLEEENLEARAAYNTALRRCHRAEDEIVQAIRLGGML